MNTLMNLSELTENELLEKVKLLSASYRNHFVQLINSTRNYEYGLQLSYEFEKLIQIYKSKLDVDEIEDIKLLFIQLRLNCLDKLDRWNAYIDYYDQVESDGIFEHFLQYEIYRYEVVKRKIQKSMKSDKLGNLMHHPQSELTDQQIEERARDVIKWIVRLERNGSILH